MRLRGLVAMAVLVLAAPTCGSSSPSIDTCQVCAMADLCCEARTANPDSNCRLQATCEMFTGDQRATAVSGCRDYLRIGSIPPAPAVCGPHPDAD
jgi:hypothetical protein